MRIGAFILLGLVVFLAIIYLLGAQARYFERKYALRAEFTEVGGLIEGATVRLAGVQIGRVTSVDLPPHPGGKVRKIDARDAANLRSEEHTSELQSQSNLVCRLLLEKKKKECVIYSDRYHWT